MYRGVGNADPSSDQIKYVEGTGTYTVDDDAAIILYTTDGRSKQITGKQFNAIANDATGMLSNLSDSATAVFTKEVNGLDRVRMAAVKVQSINVSGTSNDVYGYIVDDARESNGNIVYSLWTSDNQFIENVVEENSYNAADRSKGTVIGFSNIDSDNVIHDVDLIGNVFDDDLTPLTSAPTANETYVGGNQSEATGYISVAGQKLDVTADTKVLFVDSAESGSDAGIEYTYGTDRMIEAQYDEANSAYVRNVFFTVSDDTSELEMLVLDTTGAFDGFEPKDTAADDDDEESTTTKDNITVTTDNSIPSSEVITSINASGDLTIAMPVPANSTVSATVTVKIDRINANVSGPSQIGDQIVWTVTGRGLADNNNIAVDVENYTVTKIVTGGSLTFTGLPTTPNTGAQKAELTTTAPVTTVEGLGDVSAVAWTESGGTTADEVDSGDTWTAVFTVAAADGYQFDTTTSAYTVVGAESVTATTSELTVTFKFTIS